MKYPRLSRSSQLATAIAALLASQEVKGASSSWNVDASGDWATATNWASSTIPGATSGTTNADIATFGNTLSLGPTVTVDANRNIGGITFSNTSDPAFGFTLSGGSLLLSSGGVIKTDLGNGNHEDIISTPIQIQGNSGAASFTANATSANSVLKIGAVTGVSSALSTTTVTLNGTNTGQNAITGVIGNGSGGGVLEVSKSGSGYWILGGNNTYTGATTISGGRLTITSANALGGSSVGTSVASGASLYLFSLGMTVGNEALSLSGTGTSSDGALINNGENIYQGLVSLAGPTLITSINATLTLANTGTITGSGNALTIGGASHTTINSIIGTGSGTVTKTGAGTMTMTGDNTYTGLTTVSQGVLNIQHNNALGTTADKTIVASGGALQLQGGITTPAEALNIGGSGIASDGALRNVSGDNIYGGLLTLTGSTRINSDADTLTLSNTGTITATTTSNVLSFGGAGDITVNSNLGTDRVVAVPPSTTRGTVIKDGTGTLTLTGNNSYTGLTTITDGTLKLGASGDSTNGPLGRNNNGTLVSTGATLDLNGYTLSTAEALTLNGYGLIVDTTWKGALMNGSSNAATYSGLITMGDSSGIVATGGDIVLSNTGTITASGTDIILALDGPTSGNRIDSVIGTGTTGAVYKYGIGTWTLTNQNTYSGDTTITAGILQLGNGGTTGSLSPSSAINNDANLTINRSSTTTQGTDFNNVIAGTGSFTQAGSGTTVMSGLNTYDGVTTIKNGVLSVATLINGGLTSSIGDSSNAAANLVFDGGALKYTGLTASTNRAFTISDSKTGTIEVTSASSNLTISGASATTTGSLSKTGSGTLTLTGQNNYSGGTTVTGGTLAVNNTGGSGTGSGAVTVQTGAKLSGTGIISGLTTIESGGTHAPGNSPGVETFGGGVTYNSGSVFEWELSSNVATVSGGSPGTGVRGTDFDGVTVTSGAVTISDAAIFKIVLGTAFDPSTAFWDSRQVWSVFNVTGTKDTVFKLFQVWNENGADDPSNDTQYTTDYSSQGYFSFAYGTDGQVANSGNLIWTAVPEPTGALAGLLVGAGLLRRKRGRKVEN